MEIRDIFLIFVATVIILFVAVIDYHFRFLSGTLFIAFIIVYIVEKKLKK